ncbi:unnamed protein product [Moneuplotes crassus]|uniref:Uncharacterized protein n=1 Tax=Euplotes crassus TaxID=5936 RepID=A0AAD1X4R3_EUPCR|nr:unnamed protein product [Moneuplotes crassus]
MQFDPHVMIMVGYNMHKFEQNYRKESFIELAKILQEFVSREAIKKSEYKKVFRKLFEQDSLAEVLCIKSLRSMRKEFEENNPQTVPINSIEEESSYSLGETHENTQSFQAFEAPQTIAKDTGFTSQISDTGSGGGWKNEPEVYQGFPGFSSKQHIATESAKPQILRPKEASISSFNSNQYPPNFLDTKKGNSEREYRPIAQTTSKLTTAEKPRRETRPAPNLASVSESKAKSFEKAPYVSPEQPLIDKKQQELIAEQKKILEECSKAKQFDNAPKSLQKAVNKVPNNGVKRKRANTNQVPASRVNEENKNNRRPAPASQANNFNKIQQKRQRAPPKQPTSTKSAHIQREPEPRPPPQPVESDALKTIFGNIGSAKRQKLSEGCVNPCGQYTPTQDSNSQYQARNQGQSRATNPALFQAAPPVHAGEEYKEVLAPRNNDKMTYEEVMRIAEEEEQRELEERRKREAIEEKESLRVIQQLQEEQQREASSNPNNPVVSEPPQQESSGIPNFLLYGQKR